MAFAKISQLRTLLRLSKYATLMFRVLEKNEALSKSFLKYRIPKETRALFTTGFCSALGVGVLHAAGKECGASQSKCNRDKLQGLDPCHLTYSFLIGQAFATSIDHISQLLTQTALATIDMLAEYRKALECAISLMERYLQSNDKCELDRLWHEIVAAKSKCDTVKAGLNSLDALLLSVTTLMQTAAAGALQAGCDFLNCMATERLNGTNREIDSCRDATRKIEDKYLQLQSQINSNGEDKKKCGSRG